MQPELMPSRRQMIQAMGGGLGSLGLASVLSNPAIASQRAPHFAPKAKRVIQLFMNGGPYQGDTFDPKPLLEKYAGQRPPGTELRTERKTAGMMPSPYQFFPSGQSGVPV